MKEKTYTIFSYRLAKELIKSNCKLVDIELNYKENGIVFYFIDDERVREKVKMFTELKEIRDKYKEKD